MLNSAMDGLTVNWPQTQRRVKNVSDTSYKQANESILRGYGRT